MDEELQSLETRRKELKREKTEMKSAEQEVAILLHKRDVGRDMSRKVDGEMEYFSGLVQENRARLDVLLEEDGVLRGFLRLADFLEQSGEGLKQKVDLALLDDPKRLSLLGRRLVSKFRKMHLHISTLSDLFKDNQGRIKQKKTELEHISRQLLHKERLLEKVVQPDNDFQAIAKSFFDDISLEGDRVDVLFERSRENKLGKLWKSIKSETYYSNQNITDDNDKSLKEAKATNRRLLNLVGE